MEPVQGDYFQNPMVLSLWEKIHTIIIETDTSIQFMWMPGHTGIESNEFADAKAEKAVLNPNVAEDQEVLYTDLKCLIIHALFISQQGQV